MRRPSASWARRTGLERAQDRGLSIQRTLDRRVDPGPTLPVLSSLFHQAMPPLPAFATGAAAASFSGVTSITFPRRFSSLATASKISSIFRMSWNRVIAVGSPPTGSTR